MKMGACTCNLQVAGFKQWQTDFNRTVNRGAKAIRIAAPIIKKLTPAEQKRFNITDECAIVGYRYLPVFDVSQTSGEPVLSTKDFVKENLADQQNVTSLYNAFKDYLNQQTDLKVSEVPLATLKGAEGYFQPSTNEIVIGSDEPDNALKLKTLYHEYAHSQLLKIGHEPIRKSKPKRLRMLPCKILGLIRAITPSVM